MKPALVRLRELVAPPRSPVLVPNVSAVSAFDGLPSDYPALLSIYGRGAFDNFLWLHNPPESGTPLDLDRARRSARSELVDHQTDEFVLTQSASFLDSLVPCAVTDNGDRCFWRTDRSSRPNRWTVVAHTPRDGDWDEYPGTLAEFLYAVMSRQYSCPIFPDDFPDDNPEFTPYDATRYL